MCSPRGIATEDILPASDNIPVRFTVGIVTQNYLILLHTVSGERASLASNPPQL
jgi:hypothetical protein